MTAVGIDGCREGWVSVLLDDARFADARLHPSFADVIGSYGDAEVLAVDIPIGLSETGTRAADVLARRFLRGQASTVFTTPPRSVVEQATYALAAETSIGLTGKSLSRQSFALVARILEVDKYAVRDDRVREVHPEVSFRALAGGQPLPRKKSWNGQVLRRELLAEEGIVLPDALGQAGATAPDDVLDAGAAAWSAHRIASGQARSLPDPPETYADRAVAIWY